MNFSFVIYILLYSRHYVITFREKCFNIAYILSFSNIFFKKGKINMMSKFTQKKKELTPVIKFYPVEQHEKQHG